MNTHQFYLFYVFKQNKFYKSKSINNFNSNLLKPPLNKTIWPYSVSYIERCVYKYVEMKNVYVCFQEYPNKAKLVFLFFNINFVFFLSFLCLVFVGV